MSDSAEAIAKVVADLRAGSYLKLAKDVPDEVYAAWNQLFKLNSPIVDATKLYENFIDNKRIALYEDHVMCPPWPVALVCYVNDHGNVHVMLTMATQKVDDVLHWQPKGQEHRVDWNEVKWVVSSFLWLGGRGKGQPIPTAGPCQAWDMAVNEDGSMQDLRWTNYVPHVNREEWDNCIIAVLQTYNFLNCINVEIAEPHRTRAEHKRIQREIGDYKVNEIRVRPITKSRQQGETYYPNDFTLPLHTVRGHFARYGPDYNRKLLFGKYAGRFFIPAHARGSEDAGIRDHNYTIETDNAST